MSIGAILLKGFKVLKILNLIKAFEFIVASAQNVTPTTTNIRKARLGAQNRYVGHSKIEELEARANE